MNFRDGIPLVLDGMRRAPVPTRGRLPMTPAAALTNDFMFSAEIQT